MRFVKAVADLLVTSLLVLPAIGCGSTSTGPARGTDTPAPASTQPQAPGINLRTPHYDLYLEAMDAREAGALVEAYYQRLKRFFGAEPAERLNVRIIATQRGMADQMDKLVADGVISANFVDTAAKKLAGAYVPTNKTAYVPGWNGPFTTRILLLHECTHQFHYLARTNNQQPRSAYYVEGLAEHLSMDAWDAGSPNAVPALETWDNPAAALDDFQHRHQSSLRAVATDLQDPVPGETSYGGAWGLVSFLLAEHRDQFRAWSAALDALADPAPTWDNAFGKDADARISAEYRQWLDAHQESWSVMYGDWHDANSHTFEGGSPDGWAVAIAKQPLISLSASVQTASDSASAGLVIGFESPAKYRWVEVTADGDVYLNSYTGQKWTDEKIHAVLVRNGRRFRIAARHNGRTIDVMVDGTLVLRRRMPEASGMGLAVSNGAATFGTVEWETTRRAAIH